MNAVLKSLAAKLPEGLQRELKRLHFRRQIRDGSFNAGEPEVALLSGLVAQGDWVIDVGANVGQYTYRLSELVGPRGRVISIEPMPETMSLLAANVLHTTNRNVTLLNTAVSDATELVGMDLPRFSNGMPNYYQAQIVPGEPSSRLSVLTITIDSLQLPNRVAFVKIDAEGHEAAVLRGMTALIARDKPVLLIETSSPQIEEFLSPWDYVGTRISGSPNLLLVAGTTS